MEMLNVKREESKLLDRVRSLPEGVINFQIDQRDNKFYEQKDQYSKELYKTIQQHKREYKLSNKVFRQELKNNIQNLEIIKKKKIVSKNWKKLRNIFKFCSYVNNRIMQQRLQGKTILIKNFKDKNQQKQMYSLLSGHLMEKDIKIKRKNYILYSDDRFSKFWLFINMIVLIILTFFLPYKIAFIENESKNLQIFENIILILFSLDIILSFFTAIKYHDKYIDNLQLIAIGYLKTWFIIDVISVIPLEYFDFQNKSLSQITKFLKILKILRLTRLIKLSDNVKESKFIRRLLQFINVNKQFTEFFTFMIFIIILTHLSGCLWFFITKNYGQNNQWVQKLQINFQGDSSELYVLSFYWAITTICTVGFGDLYPIQLHEKIFCLVWIMVGVAFYSYTLSSLTTIVNKFYQRKLSISKRFQFLNEINKEKQIDQCVLEQLTIQLEYQEQITQQQQNTSSKDLMKDIPLDLTYKLTKHLNKELIEKITIFHGKNLQFLTQITPFFSQQKFQIGQTIYKQHDHSSFVYFILKGKIGFFKNANLMFKTFVEGSYFGEIEILKSCLRQYTVKAIEDCKIIKLPNEIFIKNLKKFPEINEEFLYIALRRNIELKKSAKQLEKIMILNQKYGLSQQEKKNIDNKLLEIYQATQLVKKVINNIDNKILSKKSQSIQLDFIEQEDISILYSQQSFQSDDNQKKNFSMKKFQQKYDLVKKNIKNMNSDLYKILTQFTNKNVILRKGSEKKEQGTNINITDKNQLLKNDFSIDDQYQNSDEQSEYKQIKIIRKNNFFTNDNKNYINNLQENQSSLINFSKQELQSLKKKEQIKLILKNQNKIITLIMSQQSENEFNDVINFLLQLIQDAKMDQSSIKSNSFIQDTSISQTSENEKQTIAYIIKKMKTFKNNFNYLKIKYKQQNQIIKNLQEENKIRSEQIQKLEFEQKELKQLVYEQEQTNNYQTNEIQQLKKQQLQAQVLLTSKNINNPKILNQEINFYLKEVQDNLQQKLLKKDQQIQDLKNQVAQLSFDFEIGQSRFVQNEQVEI